MIDDGKRGRHNLWSSLSETIYTIGIDFVPAVASAMADRVQHKYGPDQDAEWADLLLSTADLPDASMGAFRSPQPTDARPSWRFSMCT